MYHKLYMTKGQIPNICKPLFPYLQFRYNRPFLLSLQKYGEAWCFMEYFGGRS